MTFNGPNHIYFLATTFYISLLTSLEYRPPLLLPFSSPPPFFPKSRTSSMRLAAMRIPMKADPSATSPGNVTAPDPAQSFILPLPSLPPSAVSGGANFTRTIRTMNLAPPTPSDRPALYLLYTELTVLRIGKTEPDRILCGSDRKNNGDEATKTKQTM